MEPERQWRNLGPVQRYEDGCDMRKFIFSHSSSKNSSESIRDDLFETSSNCAMALLPTQESFE